MLGVGSGGQGLPRDGSRPALSPQAFHYMSFAILVFFMLEIFLKIYVFRLEFFHHKFEILDAIVVVVSFVLDLILFFKNHQFEALGLLILLRLWRVARIINGASPMLLGCGEVRGGGGHCGGYQGGNTVTRRPGSHTRFLSWLLPPWNLEKGRW